MKEFMFYIRNERDAKASLSEEQHLSFIKKCETHIGILKKEGRLIASQPLLRTGVVLKKTEKGWAERELSGDAEVQVGYYLILAKDLDEAIRLAKDNPEFEYVPSATIEVRPVKTSEKETGFVYPVKK